MANVFSSLFIKYITSKTPADEEEIRYAFNGTYEKPERRPLQSIRKQTMTYERPEIIPLQSIRKQTMTKEEYNRQIDEALRLAKRRKK